ncbi:hypothetical protein H0H87_008066 [Tephrocybe sp. NHM501043]|nr:hypothetical protein H0H87_008066 [Tephrocybe sp. NHM501043]
MTESFTKAWNAEYVFLKPYRDFAYAALDWAKHGICGRGVLLDLVDFYTEGGSKELPYDPCATHAIHVADLEACAKKQGVEFRQGDILLLRVGFINKYNTTTNEIRAALGSKPETLLVSPLS